MDTLLVVIILACFNLVLAFHTTKRARAVQLINDIHLALLRGNDAQALDLLKTKRYD